MIDLRDFNRMLDAAISSLPENHEERVAYQMAKDKQNNQKMRNVIQKNGFQSNGIQENGKSR